YGHDVAKLRNVFPSSERRGGCASRKYREAPLKAQTGWSVQNDHPVRAFLRLPSAISFDGTASPPVPGGEYAIQIFQIDPLPGFRIEDALSRIRYNAAAFP